MLSTEPSAQPRNGVVIDGLIGFADRTETKIIGPAFQPQVQSLHHFRGLKPTQLAVGVRVYRVDHAFDTLLRRTRACIGSARLRRVTPAKRVPQKIETTIRYARISSQ